MITPLDIENKKFSKQMVNGYNVDEVDEFLDEITADYEKLYKGVYTFRNISCRWCHVICIFKVAQFRN